MGIPLANTAAHAGGAVPGVSKASTLGIFLGIGRTFLHVVAVYLLLLAVTTAIHFPYHTDAPVPLSLKQSASKFYEEIYSVAGDAPADTNGADYIETAKGAVQHDNVVPRVTRFAQQMGLMNKRVLDVGAGTGYLQDVVPNYVGLDISSTAKRFFHKPFVEASATDMPFHDGEFDAAWSIWVLEHVPNPEQALLEMRRVVKDGGLLYLLPAWNCIPWAAEGYPVRPYQDLSLKGKLIKAAVPILVHPVFVTTYLLPTRLLRRGYASISGEPTRLHYNQLTPNFDHYWMPDSDAINSIDFYEMLLWFTSRGDECLSCGKHPILEGHELVIRVHKKKPQPS
jgi:ubiquinone/menaquinone biosynthesis C-methylase UbiE